MQDRPLLDMAEHYRAAARKARDVADRVTNPAIREGMLRIAQQYDGMSTNAGQVRLTPFS